MLSPMQLSALAAVLLGVCSNAAVIRARDVQNCKVNFSYVVTNASGGPGSAPFTNIATSVNIDREGTGVWGSQDNVFAESYSRTIPASEWGGADEVRIESHNNGEGVSFTSCSLTDTNSGQYYEGVVGDPGLQEGTATEQTSTCVVDFYC